MLTLMCIDIRNMRSGEGVSTARTGSKQDPKYHPSMKIFIDQVPNLQRLERQSSPSIVYEHCTSMLQLEISSTHTHHPPHRQRQGWLRVQLMPHKLVFTSLVVNDHNPQSSDDIDRNYNCGLWIVVEAGLGR